MTPQAAVAKQLDLTKQAKLSTFGQSENYESKTVIFMGVILALLIRKGLVFINGLVSRRAVFRTHATASLGLMWAERQDKPRGLLGKNRLGPSEENSLVNSKDGPGRDGQWKQKHEQKQERLVWLWASLSGAHAWGAPCDKVKRGGAART